MNSPTVRGKRPSPAEVSGSSPVMSSRRATRIAKQRESNPDSAREGSAAIGANVLFCSAATVEISANIFSLNDKFIPFSQESTLMLALSGDEIRDNPSKRKML